MNFEKGIDYDLNITCNKTTTQPSNMLAMAKFFSILSTIFVPTSFQSEFESMAI